MLSFDEQVLVDEISQLLTQVQTCIVKIVLTRKPSGRGYAPASHETNRFVAVYPWGPSYHHDFIVAKSTITLGQQPALAGLKHLNRLENVLASKDIQNGLDEVLLCDAKGFVIEGTKTNLFALFDHWLTPKLDNNGVEGVVRAWLLDTIKDVACQDIPYQALYDAKAIFVCNSVIGVQAVEQVDGKKIPTQAVEQIKKLYNKVW